MAIQVRSDEELLGGIWVVQGTLPFDRAAEEALCRAADVVADALIRRRVMSNSGRRRRVATVEALLRGSPDDVPETAGTFDAGDHLTVVAFRVEDADGGREGWGWRVADLISTQFDSFRRRAWTASLPEGLYAVIASDSAIQAATVTRLVGDLTDALNCTSMIGLTAGVGSTVRDASDLGRSRRDADVVLTLLNRFDVPHRVASLSDVAAQALLSEVDALLRDRDYLPSGKAKALFDHDEDHGTQYVATMQAYLSTFGDIPLAAQTLHVHPNTFRYRMKRIVELIDFDPTDHVERLALDLQLRAATGTA
jgi:hypothetical protein